MYSVAGHCLEVEKIFFDFTLIEWSETHFPTIKNTHEKIWFGGALQ